MGRHGLKRQRRPVPWELLGWGAFSCVVGALLVVWMAGSWRTAGLVLAVGVLGIGAVAVLSMVDARRPRRRPPP